MAEDAIPGDALAERRGERKAALLALAEHRLAERLRLGGELVSRGSGEHGPCVGEGLALPVDAPIREQEASDEREQDGGAADAGDEADGALPLALLLDLLAGE